VARDRQRAKQRKARRAQNPGPARSKLERTDLPGELEHASGEVEEFEAALISGADGEPAEAVEDEAVHEEGVREEGVEEEDVELGPEDLDDEAFDELEDEVDDATLEEEAVEARPPARRHAATPGAPTRKGPGRFIGFLRASWAELQRVQWPDRRQVAQATGVVIGFVIIAGLYLGVADWVAKQVVNAII
jgi:preprotein translocase SecE subunit